MNWQAPSTGKPPISARAVNDDLRFESPDARENLDAAQTRGCVKQQTWREKLASEFLRAIEENLVKYRTPKLKAPPRAS